MFSCLGVTGDICSDMHCTSTLVKNILEFLSVAALSLRVDPKGLEVVISLEIISTFL